MSAFIPDASITLPWCFSDEQNAISDSLLTRLEAGEEALVPAHWALELANVLTLAKRRGRIAEVDILEFLADLAQFAIRIDNEGIDRTFTVVRHLADQYSLTSYDAAYLELALRTGVPLATSDQDLLKAARKAGAAVVDNTTVSRGDC